MSRPTKIWAQRPNALTADAPNFEGTEPARDVEASCEARAAREAARLAVVVAIATIVPHESGMLVRHHRARLGTLLFTVLRCGGR